MTCAGKSRSRSLARPVSARTRRTSSIGNVLAITPRLMWSLRRMPAGRPAGTRAIAVAHPRASASMAQPHLYVNGIAVSPDYSVRPDGARHQWRKVPPRELSVDLVADERPVRATRRAEAPPAYSSLRHRLAVRGPRGG